MKNRAVLSLTMYQSTHNTIFLTSTKRFINLSNQKQPHEECDLFRVPNVACDAVDWPFFEYGGRVNIKKTRLGKSYCNIEIECME